MTHPESRNKREGRYFGRREGQHRRGRCVPFMLNVSQTKWKKHVEDSIVRAKNLSKIFED